MSHPKMFVRILPYTLRILNFPPSSLKQNAYAITRAILVDGRTTFFCYTRSENDVNIITEDRFLDHFDLNSISLHPSHFRAIEVTVDEVNEGYTSTGVISALTKPLAEYGISIYHISGFSNDLSLVRDYQITKAIKCLKEHFDIQTEGLTDSLENINIEESQRNEIIDTHYPPGSTKHLIGYPDQQVYIHSIEKDSIDNYTSHILTIIFFSDENQFFNYTETEEEVSMLLTIENARLISSESLSQPWVGVSFKDPPGIESVGVVHSIAKPLSEEGIGLFYLSTRLTSFILVKKVDYKKATKKLQESGFSIE